MNRLFSYAIALHLTRFNPRAAVETPFIATAKSRGVAGMTATSDQETKRLKNFAELERWVTDPGPVGCLSSGSDKSSANADLGVPDELGRESGGDLPFSNESF